MSSSQQQCTALEPPTTPNAGQSTDPSPSQLPSSAKQLANPLIDSVQTIPNPSTTPSQHQPQHSDLISTPLHIASPQSSPSANQPSAIHETTAESLHSIELETTVHPDDFVQLQEVQASPLPQSLPLSTDDLDLCADTANNEGEDHIPDFLLAMTTGTKRSLSRPQNAQDDQVDGQSQRNDDDNTGDASGLEEVVKRQRLLSGAANNNPITSLSMRASLPSSSVTSTPIVSSVTTTSTTTSNLTPLPTANSTPASGKQAIQGSSNKLLIQQYKDLLKTPPPGVLSIDIETSNIFKWKVTLTGPPDTPFEGGIFPCSLTFPPDYPTSPPTFFFNTPGFCHPNVFPDGRVCISILHSSTESLYDHEPQSERWKPILGVEAILLSVVSLLNEPNTDSPANVDMARLFRENVKEYKKRIVLMVRKSQQEALNQQ